MKQFQLLEDYKVQGLEAGKALQKYNEKVVTTGEHVANLKAQYEALFQEEMRIGIDKSDEKKKMLAKVEDAEKDYALAQEENSKAHAYFSGQEGNIKRPEVIQAWLNEYVPAVKAEVMGPILERIEAARSEYLNAMLDIVEIADEYNDITREIREMDVVANSRGEQPYTHSLSNPVTLLDVKKPITDGDLRMIEQYRQLPNGVKRVPIKVKGVK